jgi:hypothetical protein
MDSKEKVVDSPSSGPKERDYAPLSQPTQVPMRNNDLRIKTTDKSSDSDSDTTATNDSDEFNWDDEDEPEEKRAKQPKAKRGRALYLAIMKLARPVRITLIGILGAGILITPLIVIHTRFNSSPAKQQVHVWSMWLTIIWVAGCITTLVVDILPRVVVALIVLFGGQVERLKIQIEACYFLSRFMAPTNETFSADDGCFWLAQASSGYLMGMDCT